LPEAYRLVQAGTAFVGEVLAATRRLRQVGEPYRPLLALAAVYGVYLFTMTAWKMSQEFTTLLPPFPAVLKTMLGLTRWEGRPRGPEGQSGGAGRGGGGWDPPAGRLEPHV
ncbi:MAG: hypothetical protein OWV35_07875, partial [Firmicutes bacterium]|nr:hypothetical protein [Bacillota bacterium]